MIKRISKHNVRYYEIIKNDMVYTYPSVTSILSKTKDTSGLDEWRNSIGEEAAIAITKESTDRGSLMHKLLELYLTDENRSKEKIKDYFNLVKSEPEYINISKTARESGCRLFYKFVLSNCFNDIKRVLALEQYLYSSKFNGYAGAVDFIYETTDNKIKIIDFKSASKPKTINYIEDYFLQESAYYVAYYVMTGIIADSVECWIANELEDSIQIFKIDKSTLKEYILKFKHRCELFHSKFKDK